MGYVRRARAYIPLATAMLLFAVGCTTELDPAAPCSQMDLGQAAPASVVSNRYAPVLAIADETSPAVVHWKCDASDEGSCTLLRTPLPLDPASQVMITADGGFVVAIDGGQMQCFEVDRDGPGTLAGCFAGPGGPFPGDASGYAFPTDAFGLVASLRNSSWVLARDQKGHLLRYGAGQRDTKRIGSPGDTEFTVVAVGHRHAVVSTTVDNQNEDLYVIEGVGADNRGNPQLRKLLRARAFERVVVGPNDERVMATSGTGSNAETFVFEIDTGYLLDRFPGSAASGRVPHDDLPGLRPISPDGSHFAYRTPSGAAALRNLDQQSSCLVRSATHGGHDIVAFSADGVVYLESELGPGQTRLQSWDPATRHLAALAEPSQRLRLASVPARRIDRRAWAIGVRDGNYTAVQEWASPQSLDLGDALFLPRDDERMWIASSSLKSSGTVRTMTLRRVDASMTGDLRSYTFPMNTAVEVSGAAASSKPHPFEAVFSGSSKVCLSTGTPGSRASQCGAAGDTAAFAGAAAPASASPGNDDPFEPDPPTTTSATCRGDNGTREPSGMCDGYYLPVDGCCYPAQADACVAAQCSSFDACVTTTGAGAPTVSCGSSDAPPQ